MLHTTGKIKVYEYMLAGFVVKVKGRLDNSDTF